MMKGIRSSCDLLTVWRVFGLHNCSLQFPRSPLAMRPHSTRKFPVFVPSVLTHRPEKSLAVRSPLTIASHSALVSYTLGTYTALPRQIERIHPPPLHQPLPQVNNHGDTHWRDNSTAQRKN